MENKQPDQEGLSYDSKTLITIILLIVFYPVGLVLMFVWMKWPWWVKALVGFPLLLVPIALLAIVAVAILATINPRAQMNKARDATMRNNALELVNATERYYTKMGNYPWGGTNPRETADIRKEIWLDNLVTEGELKSSFVERLKNENLMSMMADSNGMKVCFVEQSGSGLRTDCVPELDSTR